LRGDFGSVLYVDAVALNGIFMADDDAVGGCTFLPVGVWASGVSGMGGILNIKGLNPDDALEKVDWVRRVCMPGDKRSLSRGEESAGVIPVGLVGVAAVTGIFGTGGAPPREGVADMGDGGTKGKFSRMVSVFDMAEAFVNMEALFLDCASLCARIMAFCCCTSKLLMF